MLDWTCCGSANTTPQKSLVCPYNGEDAAIAAKATHGIAASNSCQAYLVAFPNLPPNHPTPHPLSPQHGPANLRRIQCLCTNTTSPQMHSYNATTCTITPWDPIPRCLVHPCKHPAPLGKNPWDDFLRKPPQCSATCNLPLYTDAAKVQKVPTEPCQSTAVAPITWGQ